MRNGRFDKVCSRKRSVFQPVSNRTRCFRENPAADLTNNKKIAMIIRNPFRSFYQNGRFFFRLSHTGSGEG